MTDERLQGLPLLADTGARTATLRTGFADALGDTPDVAYVEHDSPVGRLLLARTPRGLARVAFLDVEGDDEVLASLAQLVSPRILRTERGLDTVRRELDEYFAGGRRAFDVPLDLTLAHGFRHEVLEHLRSVAFGATVSYSDLAAMSGRPRAVRAAASACANNPVPIVVPCHRVVRSDGSLGGYLGGLDAKRTLLALERATTPTSTE
jgi:methylated-DNA-[protein]-cysteine S-methyltransferase